MGMLRLLVPVRRFVCLSISQLLLVCLGFVFLLATTEFAEMIRGTFIRSLSTLVVSLSPTPSCSSTVSRCHISQWAH